MNKLLVDTNILIYGIDENSQFYMSSRKILNGAGRRLVTTSKNIVEFLTVVTRHSGYNLKVKVALEILEEVIQNMDVIYPTQDSLAIFWGLMKRYQPTGLRIHDIEIISIGLAHEITQIATFNKEDFKKVKEISLIAL